MRPFVVLERLTLRGFVKGIPDAVGRPATVIGRTATGGRLWVGAAGGLALLGPRGRRASLSGLTAYAAASAIANGPAKWVAGRSRPRGFVLADLPRLGRQPRTSSFPSSHTAAAVAFAAAASADLPAVAPALLLSAAAVGVARLRAVRHYPSDVVAGAALGALIGGTTALAFRRHRRSAVEGRARHPRWLGAPGQPGHHLGRADHASCSSLNR